MKLETYIVAYVRDYKDLNRHGIPFMRSIKAETPMAAAYLVMKDMSNRHELSGEITVVLAKAGRLHDWNYHYLLEDLEKQFGSID